jgi:hypothetical protein
MSVSRQPGAGLHGKQEYSSDHYFRKNRVYISRACLVMQF